ncbi:DUF6415 family natural product biosynthesis protein [Streptomyces sp. NPDC057456]|uniref:DUF6415 family natural product biosynthesis protein n=1 Tax=Streptomyces sp. NPDC057456 TaxID=3346139 RepID=UPI0036BE21C5
MNERSAVDAVTIRQAVKAGLNVWVSRLDYPGLVGLRDQLRGHVQLLLGELHALTPRMRGEARELGVHCLSRAHRIIEEADDAGATAVRYRVQDLACTARSMLTLVQGPGPLGVPTGCEEIVEAVGRRICTACAEQIGAGEKFKRVPEAALPGGRRTGLIHTDSCEVLAEQRRQELQPVP